MTNELARVKRIGKPASIIDRAEAESAVERAYADAQVLAWRSENLNLRAQNAELLAALRVCMEAIDTAHADPEAGLPSPAWHWWKAARDAIAKAEATP